MTPFIIIFKVDKYGNHCGIYFDSIGYFDLSLIGTRELSLKDSKLPKTRANIYKFTEADYQKSVNFYRKQARLPREIIEMEKKEKGLGGCGVIRVVRTDKAASVGWRVGRDHINQGLIGEGFGREGGRKGREVGHRVRGLPWVHTTPWPPPEWDSLPTHSPPPDESSGHGTHSGLLAGLIVHQNVVGALGLPR